jgi:hypothetical protein
MSGRYSWRHNPLYDGLHRNANSYTLYFGGKELAHAQEHRGGGWFWYGDGINTAGRHGVALDDVKTEAVAHFKEKARA